VVGSERTAAMIPQESIVSSDYLNLPFFLQQFCKPHDCLVINEFNTCIRERLFFYFHWCDRSIVFATKIVFSYRITDHWIPDDSLTSNHITVCTKRQPNPSNPFVSELHTYRTTKAIIHS
jgi:hypothetical protein